MTATLRIGTRGSALALWQAKWVAEELQKQHTKLKTEIIVIKTEGDRRLDVSLPEIGSKGIFTDEIEQALREERIDVAIHSLKDLPTVLADDLEISAYCKREDPRDVFISKNGMRLEELSAGACIGTSSLRRRAQVLKLNPQLCCVDIRGNVDTRLRKLEKSDELAGIILAAAGLIRLSKQDCVTQYLSEEIFLPAPAQGVIALETTRSQSSVKDLISCLNHPPSEYEARAERSFLQALEGGCHAPIGARAWYLEQGLRLKGMVSQLDGSAPVFVDSEMALAATAPDLLPEHLGKQAALNIKTKGADAILSELSLLDGLAQEKVCNG